jgi:hypothetical protein
VAILRDQRRRQAEERLATLDHAESDHVFTAPATFERLRRCFGSAEPNPGHEPEA